MKGKDNLNNNDNQCKIITHTNKNNVGIKLEHFEKIGEDFVNSLLIP